MTQRAGRGINSRTRHTGWPCSCSNTHPRTCRGRHRRGRPCPPAAPPSLQHKGGLKDGEMRLPIGWRPADTTASPALPSALELTGSCLILQPPNALPPPLLDVACQGPHLQGRAAHWASAQTAGLSGARQASAQPAQCSCRRSCEGSSHLCRAVCLEQHSVRPGFQGLEHDAPGGAVGRSGEQLRGGVGLVESHQIFGGDDLRRRWRRRRSGSGEVSRAWRELSGGRHERWAPHPLPEAALATQHASAATDAHTPASRMHP